MQRTLIFHMGPTNSGKTFQSLNRLQSAPSGVYAAPLRLLAMEVWDRCNQVRRVMEMSRRDAVVAPEENASVGLQQLLARRRIRTPCALGQSRAHEASWRLGKASIAKGFARPPSRRDI